MNNLSDKATMIVIELMAEKIDMLKWRVDDLQRMNTELEGELEKLLEGKDHE